MFEAAIPVVQDADAVPELRFLAILISDCAEVSC